MKSTELLGAILVGLGALFIFGAQLIERFFRGRVDAKINNKEEQLNEASKNSANALNEYKRLKRQYDETNGKK